MPFIAVPGVCQVVVNGHISSHRYAQVWHFHGPGSGTPWSATDLNTLVNQVYTSWNSNIRSLMGTNVVLNNVTAVDLTNTTPATAVSTGAALTGTGAGQSEPSLSVMVNFVIAARYRGGHPRTYFPPPG